MESVKTLEKHFDNVCQSVCTVEVVTSHLILKARKELVKYIGRLDSGLALLQDFLVSFQCLLKSNSSSYSHLIDEGIIQLLKVIFEQILGRVARDGPSEDLQTVIELSTDTTNILADANHTAKSNVVLELCPYFMDLLQSKLLEFPTRMEVLKSTNMLLEQCPTNVKETLLNNEDNKERISGLINLVKTVGDYEFEVGIIECLMRLFPRKKREHYTGKFFTDQVLLDGFMAIKDKDFETDCRLFLNSVNALSEDPSQGVFSLPCVSANVGRKELRKPSDGGYEEFWVDFNIGSLRLTLFCEQDSLYSQGTQHEEDLWETVAIYKTDVQQCCFNERNGMVELEICLKSPVCDIYPSQHQDVTDNKITILFMPELEAHVTHAVGCTFDFSEKKSKASTVQTPLQISMQDVQHADSHSISSHFVPNTKLPSNPQTGSQDSISKRHKVSVPSVPMTTPAASPMVTKVQEKPFEDSKGSKAVPESVKPCVKRPGSHTKVSASISTVTSAKSDDNKGKHTIKGASKEFEVPKTPQRSTRARSKAKVKTPVVTVTPPSKKTKKKIEQSADNKDNAEQVVEDDNLKASNNSMTVIPDSQPVTDTKSIASKSETTVKASVSKENALDDSGIGVDESRSLMSNTSLQVSPKAKAEENGTLERESRKSLNHDRDLAAIEENTEEEEFDEIKSVEKDAKRNKSDKKGRIQKAPKPAPYKESTKSKKSNSANDSSFGFDSLLIEEPVDSIPDSLEVPTSNSEQSSKNDTDNKRKKQTKRKTSKKRSNKKKDQAEVSEDLSKDVIPETQVILEPEDKMSDEIESVDVKGKSQKKKKTFCDVDNSLKELNDLDRQEQEKNNDIDSGLNEENLKKISSNKENATVSKDDIDPIERPEQHKRNKLGKINNSDRPKQGTNKYKANKCPDNEPDFSTKSNFELNDKRLTRSRSAEEYENLCDRESESVCSSHESTSVQIESLTANHSPKSETPQNSPAKVVENELKIKSSLKKTKSSDELGRENETGKRKSRVSFDIPNESLNEETTKSETSESIDVPSESNFENNTEVEPVDASYGKINEDEQASSLSIKKEAISKNKRSVKNSNSKEKNKVYGNNPEQSKNRKSTETVAIKIESPSKSVSSQVSSDNESDSLYIESDDSYNARRYRIENETWKSSRQSRRSSLQMKENTRSKSKKITSLEKAKLQDTSNDVSLETNTSQSEETPNTSCNEFLKSKADRKNKHKSKQPIHEFEKLNDRKARKTKENLDKDSSFEQMKLESRLDQNLGMKQNFENNDIKDPMIQTKTKPGKKQGKKSDESINTAEDSSDNMNDTNSALVPFSNETSFDNETFGENINSWSEKCSNKSHPNNLSYSMKSFKQMECDNGYNVSAKSIQAISDKRGKNMVFQMSYLKSKGTVNSKGVNAKLNKSWSKNDFRKASYDPYDFEAQCETGSMASERIGRADISKELNKKHTKKEKREFPGRKGGKDVKSDDSTISSQNSYKETSLAFKQKETSNRDKNNMVSDQSDKNDRSKTRKHKSKKKADKSASESMDINDFPDDDYQYSVIDAENDFSEGNRKNTKLVQDKKTKRWYRTEADTSEEYEIDKTHQSKSTKPEIKKNKGDREFPTVDSFNKSTDHQALVDDNMMIIDSSVDEDISQFSKILQDISDNQGKLLTTFSFNSDDQIGLNDEVVKTPCIIGSISSTPKVGSVKRKHYYPLNISVIKTPQSCEVQDSESEVEIVKEEESQKKRKTRKKKAVKYKEKSESDLEDERSECRSRMSTDSVSMLDNSQNISTRSEKSWILERRKTPKLKKCQKKYKVKKKLKQNQYENSDSESSTNGEPQEDENNKLKKVKEFLQQYIESSPLSIPTLSIHTPALTPALSIKSVRSMEDGEFDEVIPESPRKHHKKKIQHANHGTEIEATQENYSFTLNVSCQNSDIEDSDSKTEQQYCIQSPDRDTEDVESEDEKSLQRIKFLLGDSGFASGPSSEVRPSRSALKRKYPNIKEESFADSSGSSQPPSDDELEKSVFVPKKLFKFDPAVNMPKASSLDSSGTEDVDFSFQSGLSTVMAAFGADIQNHLKKKKQKLESFTKKTLRETQKHFLQTLVEQHQYQANLTDDFGARMMLEVAALEKDIQKLAEAEIKMEDFFKTQLEVIRSNEESQRKRLDNLQKVQSSFLEKTKKVNKYNLNIHKSMKEQLKKDITELQRKLVTDAQRQEFMDVRTKLQKLF